MGDLSETLPDFFPHSFLYDAIKQCKFQGIKISDDKIEFFSNLVYSVGYWITHLPKNKQADKWFLTVRREFNENPPIFTLANGQVLELSLNQFFLLKIGGCPEGPLKEGVRVPGRKAEVFGNLNRTIKNHQYFGTRTKRYAVEGLNLTDFEWKTLINCFNKLIILFGDDFTGRFSSPTITYDQLQTYWEASPLKTLDSLVAHGELPKGNPRAEMDDLGRTITDFSGDVVPNLPKNLPQAGGKGQAGSREGPGASPEPLGLPDLSRMLRQNSYTAGGREDPGANPQPGPGPADFDFDFMSVPGIEL